MTSKAARRPPELTDRVMVGEDGDAELGLSKYVRAPQAAEDVAQQLANLIRRGQLKPGDRLPSEMKLAETLGVSRPVIREALSSLRSLGLIVSKPGSGSFVTGAETPGLPLLLGRYRAADLHEVRTMLEVPAAGAAAARALPEQIANLEDLVTQMYETSEYPVFAELDARFHKTVAECTGNPIHARLIADLHELIAENSDIVLSVGRSRQHETTAEHKAIADAIAAGNVKAAKAQMEHHLDVVAKLIQAEFQSAAAQSD